MGCCENKYSNSGEDFIKDITIFMKLNSMTYNEVTAKLNRLSTMKYSISKKAFYSKINEFVNNNNHYEEKILELANAHLNDTFTINQLLFYIFAFLNHTSEENAIKQLYKIFIEANRTSDLSYASLEKILTDYLTFYTNKINFCIETNLNDEHLCSKEDIARLNSEIYTYDNIRILVGKILKSESEKGEEHVISQKVFTDMITNFKIYSIDNLRDLFLFCFGQA
jgi:hypothetical protein